MIWMYGTGQEHKKYECYYGKINDRISSIISYTPEYEVFLSAL